MRIVRSIDLFLLQIKTPVKGVFGAAGGTRTRTTLRSRDFKSLMYTISSPRRDWAKYIKTAQKNQDARIFSKRLARWGGESSAAPYNSSLVPLFI